MAHKGELMAQLDISYEKGFVYFVAKGKEDKLAVFRSPMQFGRKKTEQA